MGPLLVRLTGLYIWHQSWEGSVNPLGGEMLKSSGVCEAVASWLSKQAYAPQFIKINVNPLCSLSY